MPSLISVVLASLMASPILAAISSPNYVPFELEKRDCGFSYCDCQRVQCRLDFCFDDHVDPWILVDSASKFPSSSIFDLSSLNTSLTFPSHSERLLRG